MSVCFQIQMCSNVCTTAAKRRTWPVLSWMSTSIMSITAKSLLSAFGRDVHSSSQWSAILRTTRLCTSTRRSLSAIGLVCHEWTYCDVIHIIVITGCEAAFKRKQQLDIHICEVHQGEGKLKCDWPVSPLMLCNQSLLFIHQFIGMWFHV